MDGHAAADSRGNSHTLRTSQFQHGLDILAKEGRLDSQFIRQVGLDNTRDPFEDMAQLQIGVLKFTQVNDAHCHHLGLAVDDAQDAVTHDICTWVDAQYHFLFHATKVTFFKDRTDRII